MIKNERSSTARLICSPSRRNLYRNSTTSLYLSPQILNNITLPIDTSSASSAKMASPSTLTSAIMAASPSTPTTKLVGALRRKTRPTQRNPTPPPESDSDDVDDDLQNDSGVSKSDDDCEFSTFDAAPGPSPFSSELAIIDDGYVVGRQEILNADGSIIDSLKNDITSTATLLNSALIKPIKRPKLPTSPNVCEALIYNCSNNNDTSSTDKFDKNMEIIWQSVDGNDEPVALEELEHFAKIFKQKRIKLGRIFLLFF